MNSGVDKKKIVFEKCVSLSVDTIILCRELRKDPAMWPAVDQVIRSTGSIGANVTEGQGAASKKDFAHYLRIAYKSAQESKYWFVVLIRCNASLGVRIQKLYEQADELAKILAASLKTLSSPVI